MIFARRLGDHKKMLSSFLRSGVPEEGDGGAAPTAGGPTLVSIVLPVFNEAAILRKHALLLMTHLESLEPRFQFEYIIVNDGSRDESEAIAEALAAEHPAIRVLRHPRNFGLGQALKTGFAQCRGKYVVVLDIDLSYGPEHVGLLLDRMIGTGARIVLASPYMRGGRVIEVPWLRLVLSRLANRFLTRASGQILSTLTCMVRAFDGRFLRSLHLRSMGMDVMPEMIHKAKILRASFEEVPAELNWRLQNTVGDRRRSSTRLLRQIFGTVSSGFMLRPFTFLLIARLVLMGFAAVREHLGGAAFPRGPCPVASEQSCDRVGCGRAGLQPLSAHFHRRPAVDDARASS